MAYTTIDKPTDYFNTVLYTGNGTDNHSITGVNFQPDFVWIKPRNESRGHHLQDAIRGVNGALISNENSAEYTGLTNVIKSFDSDGFTLGTSNDVNKSSNTHVAWNWLAGGSAPAITYTVKVVSDSGNKYRFDDFGTSAVTLDLQEGGTYTFDQSDSSNSGHPLRFSTTSNGTHGGGSEYTTGVTTTGTPGSAGAKTVITVAASAPTLYYYCTQHSGMGGQANTNSTFGSSNFSGSIQANVSANTTAGFSIVSYTGTDSVNTIGHGLGSKPKMIIVKDRDAANDWFVYAEAIGYSMSAPDPETDYLKLNSTDARVDNNTLWNDTAPTSSVFTIGTNGNINTTGNDYIAYCFAEKKAYSKFGSYTGNGNNDGTFIFTGFKPAWVLIKRTDTTSDWLLFDNKRAYSYNLISATLKPNTNASEDTNGAYNNTDFISNGFKLRQSNGDLNASGGTYIYMAFAENPFVSSEGIPCTAR